MFAFRNQILFSQVCVVKGSQFTATVYNCLDIYVSKFSKETEQAVYLFISYQSVWQSCNERINYCQICIHSEFVAGSKNCVRCWTLQERYWKSFYIVHFSMGYEPATEINWIELNWKLHLEVSWQLSVYCESKAWDFNSYSKKRSRSDSVNSFNDWIRETTTPRFTSCFWTVLLTPLKRFSTSFQNKVSITVSSFGDFLVLIFLLDAVTYLH